MFHIHEDRRRRVRGREIRRAYAQQAIGSKHPYASLAGPIVAKLALTVVIVAYARMLYEAANGLYVAAILAAVGALLVAVWAIGALKGSSPQARVMARATGAERSPRWHGLAVAGAGLIFAAYLMWPLP